MGQAARFGWFAAAATLVATLGVTVRRPATVVATGEVIGVRNAHAMVFDVEHARTLLFGGADAGAVRGDIWTWDGQRWSRLPALGPAPRTFPALAYDSLHHHALLFGGRSVLFGREGQGDTFLADTWTFDGQTWQQQAVAGPPARAEAAVTFDAARGRVVLFGGYAITGGHKQRLGDTWEWDGAAWSRRAESGPQPRNGALLVFDPVRGECVLSGGSGGPLADTWTWDGVRWQSLALPVPGRFNAAAVWDAASRAVLRFGGWDGHERTADTFLLDRSGWMRRVGAAPPARNHAALAYDTRRGRAVLFGGHDGDHVLGDTWEWDGRRWELRQDAPAQRRLQNGH